MPRMTKQKKLLWEESKKFSAFFNAYELQEKVLKKDNKIGLATIYRFLNSLEQEGEIHSFLCGNKKVYSNNKKIHAIFKCERCGKLKHIKIKNVDFLKNQITDEVCHFQLELTGVCVECKRS